MERAFKHRFSVVAIAKRVREACDSMARNGRVFTDKDRHRFLRIASATGRSLNEAVRLFERVTGKFLSHDTASAWMVRAGREPLH